jgi:hypothetical protein
MLLPSASLEVEAEGSSEVIRRTSITSQKTDCLLTCGIGIVLWAVLNTANCHWRTCLGTAFSQCERPCSSLPCVYLGRSLRNALLNTYYTLYLFSIVQDSHHVMIIFCLMICQKISRDFLNYFHAAFSSSHSWSSDFLSCINSYLMSNIYLFFDFSITYPWKLIFQIYKFSTILIPCIYKILYKSKFDVQQRLIKFFRVD